MPLKILCLHLSDYPLLPLYFPGPYDSFSVVLMTLFSSNRFASIAASGTDWRDTARKILEPLKDVSTDAGSFNLGFLYVSDLLAEETGSILALFRSVTGIEHWVGSVGVGVCAPDGAFIDIPAISVMAGRFDENDFKI